MKFAVQDLYAFADASTKAYRAVAYFSQCNYTSLVLSKTRVAPLKMISLPMLDLIAAVIVTRLATFILSSIKCQCNVYLWCDSQIVLCCINSHKKLKLFVNTRISESLVPLLLLTGITVQHLIIQLIC